jgi:tRNA A-37 threonylcarbamoyl transferase component Bud32
VYHALIVHPGNLMVRLQGERIELFVIDLFAVRMRRTLDWHTARANLVILNRWFVLRASRSDRLRFWRAYCKLRRARGPSREEERVFALDLEQRTWISNRQFWKQRDRRCLATNRYYRRVASTAAIGHVVRDLDKETVRALFADPDEPFRRAGVKRLKDSRSATVVEWELAGRPVIYKRFVITSWRDPWLALLRPTKALRSWISGQGLRERCLPTPRPLAILHRRRLGLRRDGYLLMEKVENARDLQAYVKDLERMPIRDCIHDKRQRINQVARLVRELHRRHLSHRDLKAANVLLTEAECWMIDLVGIVRCSRLYRSRRVQNLARLHASFYQNRVLTLSDKVRFLRAYQEWGLLGKESWKRWWKTIEKATQAKVARNEKNGRPLA